MTPSDFRAWHEGMGHTYDTGAKALGVSRGTYADWLAGRSRTTGKPIKISRLVALACAALAAGAEEATGQAEAGNHGGKGNRPRSGSAHDLGELKGAAL